MSCCINCGCVLPPLNGCEESDFSYICEFCNEDSFDDCDFDEEIYGNDE